jgi:hypothetical protein
MRFGEWEPCGCGHPNDPATITAIEKAFGLSARRGCLAMAAFLSCVLGFGAIGWHWFAGN